MSWGQTHSLCLSAQKTSGEKKYNKQQQLTASKNVRENIKEVGMHFFVIKETSAGFGKLSLPLPRNSEPCLRPVPAPWNWRSVLSDGATICRHQLLKPFYIIATPDWLHSAVYQRANKWLFPDASVEFSPHQSNKISNTIDLFDSMIHDCRHFLEQIIKNWGQLTLSLFPRACQWWCPW